MKTRGSSAKQADFTYKLPTESRKSSAHGCFIPKMSSKSVNHQKQYSIQSLIKLLMMSYRYTLCACTYRICRNLHIDTSNQLEQGAGHRLGSWHHEIHALVTCCIKWRLAAEQNNSWAPGNTKSSGGEFIIVYNSKKLLRLNVYGRYIEVHEGHQPTNNIL